MPNTMLGYPHNSIMYSLEKGKKKPKHFMTIKVIITKIHLILKEIKLNNSQLNS